MPTSIPYDHPSLVLGNIVDPRVLTILKSISKCQAKVDSSQDKLNSFIMLKRSIAMTINELADMEVDVTELKGRQPEINASITKSAGDYLSSRLENETQIQQLREQLSELEVLEGLESPVDFSLSTLKTLPLSAESLKLDSQYFSFGSNQEDDTMANIEKYVRESTSNLGSKSDDIAGTVSSQINQQRQNHSIAGTLIITASCTHSNVKMFEPLVIDPDKLVSVWNSVNTNTKINTDTLKFAAASNNNGAGNETEDSANLSLLAGAGYGSSFIGMVHILNSDSSSINPSAKTKGLMDEKLKIGGWLENAAGGFGVDDGFMDNVKSMLSTQSVSSHVSVVVMGAIPSIASNQLKLSISKFAEVDPELISVVTGDESQISDTLNSDAEKAKSGARILNVQNAKIQSLIKGLGKIDHGSNNVLDINSMMTAFENYLTAIKNKDENVGVPISFNLKQLTRSQVESLWQDKYYPKKEIINNSNPDQK
ncbi:MAG: hypothetical protein H0W73_09685 [Bacteroidetes bacterium]|nr:hypothetical protein [Bacteroidota bacterium]